MKSVYLIDVTNLTLVFNITYIYGILVCHDSCIMPCRIKNIINVDVALSWQGMSQKCHKTPAKAHVVGRLIMGLAHYMIYEFLAHIFFS